MTANPFGDAEPEDSWDIDDPVGELVRNLERRAEALGEAPRRSGELAERLDNVARAAERLEARRLELDDRTRLRLEMLVGDVDVVRHMLEGGN